MTTDAQTASALERVREFNRDSPSGSPVLAWPGLRDQEPLRTRVRHGAWVLASGVPVVRVDGYAGGIALTHVEPDPTRQPAVPEVEFPMPPCPICDDGLDSDGDSLICLGCHASWDSSGRAGTWDDPHAVRCPSVARVYTHLDDDTTEQCCLEAGHGTDHRPVDGWGSWSDDQARCLIDSDGEPT